MFRATGLDIGANGKRAVSVSLFGGSPSVGQDGELALACPANLLSFRQVPVPKVKAQVRRQIVQEELELSTPFDLDSMEWDTLSQERFEWAVLASKESLKDLTAKVGEPLGAIDAAPLALWRCGKKTDAAHALIIDFGATQTTFVGFDEQELRRIRIFRRGGNDLTETLAKTLKLSLKEAEALKKSQGSNQPLCGEWLEVLLEESGVFKDLEYEKIFLAGGGAQLPGLSDFIEKRSDCSVEPLPLPSNLSPYTHAVAYGTALGQTFRAEGVNLSFSQAGTQDEGHLWRDTRWVVVPLIAMMILFTAWSEMQLELRKRQVSELQKTYETAFSEASWSYGEFNPEESVDKLEKVVTNLNYVQAHSPRKTAVVIGQLLEGLEEYQEVRLRAIRLDKGRLRIEGKAINTSQVQDLLGKWSTILSNMSNVGTKKLDKNSVSFTFEGDL